MDVCVCVCVSDRWMNVRPMDVCVCVCMCECDSPHHRTPYTSTKGQLVQTYHCLLASLLTPRNDCMLTIPMTIACRHSPVSVVRCLSVQEYNFTLL